MLAKGFGIRAIARRLDRAPSTISREVRRNAATRGGGLEYRASAAQWHADLRARRPKRAKLAADPRLRDYVEDRLAGKISHPDGRVFEGPAVPWKGRRHGRRADRRWSRAWSPEQISARLRLDFPDDESMRISQAAPTDAEAQARAGVPQVMEAEPVLARWQRPIDRCPVLAVCGAGSLRRHRLAAAGAGAGGHGWLEDPLVEVALADREAARRRGHERIGR